MKRVASTQCGFYLVYLVLTSIVCRFGECLYPKPARIARLLAG